MNNVLSEINFIILNLWYLNHEDNFKNYSKMELQQRYQRIRNIVKSNELLINEVRPIFMKMDLDKSG